MHEIFFFKFLQFTYAQWNKIKNLSNRRFPWLKIAHKSIWCYDKYTFFNTTQKKMNINYYKENDIKTEIYIYISIYLYRDTNDIYVLQTIT